ncbi:MAG: TnpV protein [Ruminococcaceae bacterium]|nr:TnpV protein [Oscillospiraceae bacterium]
MKIEYRKCGDYLIPDFELPPKPALGKYGKMRHSYLRKHKEPLFTALMMQSKLNSHLEEIDRSAQEMYECLMKQFKQQYGITEKLKAENQMLWVYMMNEIHQMAEEIVFEELIYN